MIHLANLIWFSRKYREKITLTQGCPPCVKIGKNLKSIIAKSTTSQLPTLIEPNEEIQRDFTGPISDKNNKDTHN